jgi:glycosyltransferase involved in cell wall biosynthesis
MNAPRLGLVVRDVGSMGGIARYVSELADGLARTDGVSSQTVLVGPELRDWSASDPLRIDEPSMPLGGSLALLRIPRGRFDVLHFPMHEQWPVFALRPERIVMTVHSVEACFLPPEELHGDGSRVASRLPYRLLRAARRRLRLVVTPSPTTASQIVRYLGIPNARIRVIPHGVSAAFLTPPSLEDARRRVQERGLERPYVFHLSHHQPQKNVVRLIDAFGSLGRDDAELVIAGDTSRCADAYAAAVSRAGIADRVRFLGPVEDDGELAALYRAARAFALPSVQESFGLPALEALACACPTLVGSGTGAADTVGDAGLAVDPRSVDAIAAAIGRLLDDGALRDDLAARGIERARGFTWERSIDAHIAAYEEAAA